MIIIHLGRIRGSDDLGRIPIVRIIGSRQHLNASQLGPINVIDAIIGPQGQTSHVAAGGVVEPGMRRRPRMIGRKGAIGNRSVAQVMMKIMMGVVIAAATFMVQLSSVRVVIVESWHTIEIQRSGTEGGIGRIA